MQWVTSVEKKALNLLQLPATLSIQKYISYLNLNLYLLEVVWLAALIACVIVEVTMEKQQQQKKQQNNNPVM